MPPTRRCRLIGGGARLIAPRRASQAAPTRDHSIELAGLRYISPMGQGFAAEMSLEAGGLLGHVDAAMPPPRITISFTITLQLHYRDATSSLVMLGATPLFEPLLFLGAPAYAATGFSIRRGARFRRCASSIAFWRTFTSALL